MEGASKSRKRPILGANILILGDSSWSDPQTNFGVKEEDLRSATKKRSVAQARSAFGYLSIKEMGYSGREVGKFLNIQSYSAVRCAEMGKVLFDKDPALCDLACK